MGFQIEVKTGAEGKVVLRGCEDGTIEFCQWRDVKNKDTGLVVPTLTPYKWYTSLEQAFERVFRMRVASADATTIKELVAAVKSIRKEIKEEMGVSE